MTHIVDLRPQHRQALTLASRYVEKVSAKDLGRATPCAGWDLRALMGHLIGQNHGFATAVRDGDACAHDYVDRPPEADETWPAWRASAAVLEAAFAAAPLDRRIHLIEIGPGVTVTVATAVGFQLLDTVVHTWDVARSLDIPFRPDDELVRSTLAVARRVPAGSARERPGAAFAPAVRPQDAAVARADGAPGDPWVTTLEYLGRSPAWPARPTPR